MGDQETRIQVLEYKHSQLEDCMKSIDGSLKEIVILGQQHIEHGKALERAFGEIKVLTEKVGDLEMNQAVMKEEIKPLKETRGWAMTAILGVCGMALKFIWDAVTKH